MKKLLYSILIALSLFPIHAENRFTQRAQTLLTNIKQLFVKTPAVQQPAPIPTINVGYLSIQGEIVTYTGYLASLKSLADNPAIDCIILDINCPGGSAATTEIIAEYIKTIQLNKPVFAFISDIAASGGYWLACASSYIIAPQTAQIGSIGGILSHASDKNITHIFITSGKYKAPIYKNETELDEGYMDYRQDYINKLGEIFYSKVATYRNLSVDAIKNLDAKMFLGNDALAHGLIDKIGTLNDVIEKITSEIETKNSCAYDKIAFINPDNSLLMTFNTIHSTTL